MFPAWEEHGVTSINKKYKEHFTFLEYGRLKSGAQTIWHEIKYYWYLEVLQEELKKHLIM